MTPLLSILICTLESRKPMLDRLITNLKKQEGVDKVQLLVSSDQGWMTRGAKTQSMLEMATGLFVVRLDDDDQWAEDYLSTVLPHCRPEVDSIGYEFLCYGFPGSKGKKELAAVSSRYPDWKENVDGYRYVRHTHHLVPVKREHALSAGFDPKKDHGEDYAYSMRLKELGVLKNEVFIERPMYIVRHNPHKKPGT